MSESKNPDPAARSAADATIARVLEQIGVGQPECVEFDACDDGTVRVRVVIEQDVCELLCSLSREGELIAARLIEL